MKITAFIGLFLVMFAAACTRNSSTDHKLDSKALPNDSVSSDSASTHSGSSRGCKTASSLLFEDEGLSSYTEDSIRGADVVSIQLDINDRLDIANLDGSVFGFLVLNEDGTYYTLDMPQKTTARWLIPTYDFAAFDFDAEPVNTDSDSLIIYVNKEKRKVKKAGLKYKFHTWPEYLLGNTIRLKPCNLLKAADGVVIQKSQEQYFKVIAVKGDLIKIKSNKACEADLPYLDMEGWVKWRSADGLVIDFAICD